MNNESENIKNLKNQAAKKNYKLSDFEELLGFLGGIETELHFLNSLVKTALKNQKILDDLEITEIEQEMEPTEDAPGIE